MLSLLLTFIEDEKDKQGFINLYNNYKNYIYKLCFNLVHDHFLAEDCLQETFIIVAKNFDKTYGADSQKTKNFLITIAKSVSMKVYNKNVSSQEDFFDESDSSVMLNPSAEDIAFDKYTVQELYQAIESLNDNLKLPLIFKDLYDFSYKDIAEIFGISTPALRKRITRARAEIKIFLEKNID